MSNTGLYTIGGGRLLRDARCTALAPFVGPSWVEACGWQDHHRGYPTRAVEDTDQITCGECQRIASQTGHADSFGAPSLLDELEERKWTTTICSAT